MLQFFFPFLGFILAMLVLFQFKYAPFYIRYETVFIKRTLLAKRIILKESNITIFHIEALLCSFWFFVAIFLFNDAQLMMMVFFFMAMQQSILIYRKFTNFHSPGWWLEKLIILSAVVVCFSEAYGFFHFNFDWKFLFLFSFCFFLITFTTYILKSIIKWTKK